MVVVIVSGEAKVLLALVYTVIARFSAFQEMCFEMKNKNTHDLLNTVNFGNFFIFFYQDHKTMF